MMIPYALALLVALTFVLYAFWGIGIPIGFDSGYVYPPVKEVAIKRSASPRRLWTFRPAGFSFVRKYKPASPSEGGLFQACFKRLR